MHLFDVKCTVKLYKSLKQLKYLLKKHKTNIISIKIINFKYNILQ